MHEKTAIFAVGVASVPLAISGDTTKALMSIALGISGVALARAVFINKERRATGKKPPMRESLPLTLVAMLITSVVIWDRKLGLSFSVFTGLGVGWSVILLLDIIGGWILKTGARLAGVSDKEYGIPEEQSRLLNKMRSFDHQDTSYDNDKQDPK